jgi:hypothetical protein
VKNVFGTPGNKSLKAAKWLVLYSVYFALTLIPIREVSPRNAGWQALLTSTVELVSITNFLAYQTVNPANLE